MTKKQAILTLDRFRHEIKNFEFDVNFRKLNITLLMASPPVFFGVSYIPAANFRQGKHILGTFNLRNRISIF